MNPPNALRFVKGSDDILEGWLAPFGGDRNGRDSYGTYASAKTDFMLDLFPSRPLLYDHGQDSDLGPTPIGRIVELSVRDNGVWMKAQLDKHNEYMGDIRKLIKSGALGLSSGALAHLVEIDEETGEWIRWPIAEGSVTPRPSNLLATIPIAAYASYCRSAGVELTDEQVAELGDEIVSDAAMRAKLDAAALDALPDSDFAYIDSDGGRHLPINDEAHVKAALARFNQTQFESDAKKTAAKKKILARAKKLGIDVSEDTAVARSAESDEDATRADPPEAVTRSFEDIRDDITDILNAPVLYGPAVYSHLMATYPEHVLVCRHDADPDDDGVSDCSAASYWRIPYTIGDDGAPILGAGTEEVEAGSIPAERSASPLPLSLDAQRVTQYAAGLCERTKDLAERRIRSGRVLSAANRQILHTAHAAMGTAHAALGDLLDHTDQDAEAVARAANPETWAAQCAEVELLRFLVEIDA